MAIGAAVAGLAGSVIGGRSAAKGQEAAAQTTADTARYSADLQKEMFEQGRADLTPYSTLGTTASPLLQYLVTGIMPTMTAEDTALIEQYNALGAAPPPTETTAPTALGEGVGGAPIDPTRMDPGRDYGYQPPSSFASQQGDLLGADQYAGVSGRRYPDTGIAGQVTPTAGQPGMEDIDQFALANAQARQQSINALQGGYQMQESPMYSWQQEQGERALNRQAAAKGLSGSRASLNALSDFTRGLGAQESDKQYGRLLDLTNIGRGMAATGLGAGQSYASGAGGALQSGASQSALYSGMAAQTKGSMYENIGQGIGQMATNYLGGQSGGGTQPLSSSGAYNPAGYQSTNWMGR